MKFSESYPVDCHKHDVFVSLRPELYKAAVESGQFKHNNAKRGKFRDLHNVDESKGASGERIHWLGALCEFAVAQELNLPLPEEGTFQKPDLKYCIEVKLIGTVGGRLKVKPRYAPHVRVVGVQILKGHEREPYRIPGWQTAGFAQSHSEWLCDPHDRKLPYYGVPQRELRPLSELRELIAEYNYIHDERLGHLAGEDIATEAQNEMAEHEAEQWCQLIYG